MTTGECFLEVLLTHRSFSSVFKIIGKKQENR